MPTPPKKEPPEGPGLQAARRYAQWNLGYAVWADSILDAYLNPEQAMADLDAEVEEADARINRARSAT